MTRRSRLLAALTAAGLLAATALAAAAAAPASAAPTPWRISDPAAYASALRSGNWGYTPEGLAKKSCVNRVPQGGRILLDGNIVTKSGTVRRVVRCTTPTLEYPGSGRSATGAGTTAGHVTPDATSCEAGDGQWWAETCAFDSTGLSLLKEDFSMPSNPSLLGALIFFFPGFENTSGTDILQPVLSWGANAMTGVTSDNIWYLTSWYGDNGTYYVSPSAHVNPPGTVVGEVQKGLCASGNSACQWRITTSVGSTSVSLVWPSGPEMNQILGGVMEVPHTVPGGCAQTPPTNHEAFRNLTVNDSNGAFTPTFQKYIITAECSVTPAHSSGIDTDINWLS